MSLRFLSDESVRRLEPGVYRVRATYEVDPRAGSLDEDKGRARAREDGFPDETGTEALLAGVAPLSVATADDFVLVVAE